MRLLKLINSLAETGTLICLVSKNEEVDVWSVFEQREDFELKRESVVSAKINWLPKSQNIVELAAMEFKEARGFISEAHCRAYCFRFVDSLEKQLKDAAKRLAINEITRIEDLCALAVEYSPCT